MRVPAFPLLLLALALFGCAETGPSEAETGQSEKVTFRFRFVPSEEGGMSITIGGVTATCESTLDNSAVYFLIENDASEPARCDFSCIFGDSATDEESYRLNCDDIEISANAPRAAYCRRDVGDVRSSLGEPYNLQFECK